ncbi:MAG: hypothetical protein K1X64_21790 [Myxococcaceae bacterium]|nr:hypothetical protein [Myxococcaceae bacterium]
MLAKAWLQAGLIIALAVVSGCGGNAGQGGTGGGTGSTGGGTGTGGGTQMSCNWKSGSFECGVASGVSCDKETQFCVLGDTTFGASCKAIGGTCPRCSNILPITQQVNNCGTGKTPSCSGDETTGITITCN